VTPMAREIAAITAVEIATQRIKRLEWSRPVTVAPCHRPEEHSRVVRPELRNSRSPAASISRGASTARRQTHNYLDLYWWKHRIYALPEVDVTDAPGSSQSTKHKQGKLCPLRVMWPIASAAPWMVNRLVKAPDGSSGSSSCRTPSSCRTSH
jgi:hypothetical protein